MRIIASVGPSLPLLATVTASSCPGPSYHFPAGTAPDGSLEPDRSHGSGKMRLTVALLTLACLAACDGVQTVSERSPARDDEWRQRQAELDAQAIMQGMAQARQRAEQLARTGR